MLYYFLHENLNFLYENLNFLHENLRFSLQKILMIFSMIFWTIHKISHYKVRVSAWSVETRWLGGSFWMVYRNNAGRLGSGFICVCWEFRWLGQKSGFYVPERYCMCVCVYVFVYQTPTHPGFTHPYPLAPTRPHTHPFTPALAHPYWWMIHIWLGSVRCESFITRRLLFIRH